MLAGCSPGEASDEVQIIWRDSLAVGVQIPNSWSHGDDEHPVIQLSGQNVPMLGAWETGEVGARFVPVIPFTRGMEYSVMSGIRLLGTFRIPMSHNAGPVVTHIFPQTDTVPMNLLKMYFQFSQPMREGVSRDFVAVLSDLDTIRDVFLDLQPELWNRESTLLTLWLDPGRIKRDLQPNKKLGNPLAPGRWYKLVVSDQWMDRQGMALAQGVEKRFYVTARDEYKPSISDWQLDIPSAGTNDPLSIHWREALDYVLLTNTVAVASANGKNMNASIKVGRDGRSMVILPESKWEQGSYLLRVEARLEDLAGNNLNRLFDRDLTSDTTVSEVDYHQISFVVK